MAAKNELSQVDAMLDFEKEMDLELDSRLQEAETSGGISRGSASFAPKVAQKRLEDDSDDDEDYLDDWEKTRTEEEKVNDDLFYDPKMDDEDQQWTEDIRRKYVSKDKPLPNSDAVLNCPACFVLLCLDCQRHEVYEHQYRAMFVTNCSVDSTQQLRYPKTKDKKKKKKGTNNFEAETDGNADDLFNPVTCNRCSTQVAVYDKEEVYHFFNVLASH